MRPEITELRYLADLARCDRGSRGDALSGQTDQIRPIRKIRPGAAVGLRAQVEITSDYWE